MCVLFLGATVDPARPSCSTITPLASLHPSGWVICGPVALHLSRWGTIEEPADAVKGRNRHIGEELRVFTYQGGPLILVIRLTFSIVLLARSGSFAATAAMAPGDEFSQQFDLGVVRPS